MICSVNPLFGARACCTVQGHAGVPEIAASSAMRVPVSPAHALHSSLVGGVSVAKATVVQSPAAVGNSAGSAWLVFRATCIATAENLGSVAERSKRGTVTVALPEFGMLPAREAVLTQTRVCDNLYSHISTVYLSGSCTGNTASRSHVREMDSSPVKSKFFCSRFT